MEAIDFSKISHGDIRRVRSSRGDNFVDLKKNSTVVKREANVKENTKLVGSNQLVFTNSTESTTFKQESANGKPFITLNLMEYDYSRVFSVNIDDKPVIILGFVSLNDAIKVVAEEFQGKRFGKKRNLSKEEILKLYEDKDESVRLNRGVSKALPMWYVPEHRKLVGSKTNPFVRKVNLNGYVNTIIENFKLTEEQYEASAQVFDIMEIPDFSFSGVIYKAYAFEYSETKSAEISKVLNSSKITRNLSTKPLPHTTINTVADNDFDIDLPVQVRNITIDF